MGCTRWSRLRRRDHYFRKTRETDQPEEADWRRDWIDRGDFRRISDVPRHRARRAGWIHHHPLYTDLHPAMDDLRGTRGRGEQGRPAEPLRARWYSWRRKGAQESVQDSR